MFAIAPLCLVMSPVLLDVMTSKKKETPLAKEAVRSPCHLELRNTCDIIQQALNSVSIRQEKAAWDSKQDKNRMQTQEIIIISVHVKSQKHRKIEGKMLQQSLISSLVSKSFTLRVFTDFCVACSQRCPLPPSTPHFHALLMKMAKHSIQCLAKMKLLALLHKASYSPQGENNFISDNSMLSAIYFLANDF